LAFELRSEDRALVSKRTWKWLVGAAVLFVVAYGSVRILLPHHHFSLASDAVNHQQWDEAAAHLDRYLSWRPRDASAWMLRAEIAVGQKRIEHALAALDRVPTDSSKSAIALERKGELLLSEHRGPEAERSLVTALDKNPRLVEAMLPLAQYYGILGRDRESLDLYWQAYKETGQATSRLAILKRIMSINSGLDAGELVPALELFAAGSPRDVPTQIALGAALVEAGRVSDGLVILNAIPRGAPERRRADIALANAYLQLSRVDEADELIRPLFETESPDGAVWWIVGRIAEARQRWRQAADAFAIASAQPRTAAEAEYRLALALDQLGEPDAAREHRDRAVRLEQARRELQVAQTEFDEESRRGIPSRVVPVLVRLGSLYEELGWPEASAAWCREALVLAPGNAQAASQFDRLRGHLGRVGISDMRSFTAQLIQAVPRSSESSEPKSTDRKTASSRVRWRDVAESAGIRFRYANGARGNFALRETMGAGTATFDFDADGRIDIFFVNSGDSRGKRRSEELSQLVRRRDEMQFDDVTGPAGMGAAGYFQGCAAADFDNDGFDDLFASGYRTHRLLHNNGDGTFGDVTWSLGPIRHLWGTSCAFGDLFGDGNLSLYMATYVHDNPDVPSPCRGPDGQLSYCLPHYFDGEPDLLFVNRGDGQFAESGESMGVADPAAKGLGVVIARLDDDAHPDVFVANDTTPNQLFVNWHGRGFVEDGLARGAAYGGNGRVRAGMGIACGDTANRGALDLLITNFYQEPNTFLWNSGGGQFQDRGTTAGLAGPSYLRLGFATIFLDGDNDGWLDCFVSNGHINAKNPGNVAQAMSPQWFANRGGRFEEAPHGAGAYFQSPCVGRGAAAADLNDDSLPDLVVTHQDRPPALLINETPDAGRALVLRLCGTRSNRSAIGARVTVRVGDMRLMREVVGGGSYLSASDLHLFLGLGNATEANEVTIRWPNGHDQSCGTLAAGRWEVREEHTPRRINDFAP
jgi:tetratricopeptide (TPR) repeat protein